jgi:hypothetical protein
MASDPQVKRAHVQAKCNVTTEELLQFMHEAQWMDWRSAARSSFLTQQLAFGADRFEDSRRERRFPRPLKL